METGTRGGEREELEITVVYDVHITVLKYGGVQLDVIVHSIQEKYRFLGRLGSFLWTTS